jgi:hypothetical protein
MKIGTTYTEQQNRYKGHEWFAWHPVRTHYGDWRWLESVWKYREYVKFTDASGGYHRWRYSSL